MIDDQASLSIERYESLGLVGNPFGVAGGAEACSDAGISAETSAEAHRLMVRLIREARAERPSPVWVEKADVPDSYNGSAIAQVETALIRDDGFGAIHAYLPLFMLRAGRIRSALQILAERAVMRDFAGMVSAWAADLLAGKDPGDLLAEGADESVLAELRARLGADPSEAVAWALGPPEVERDSAAAGIADLRLVSQDPEPEEDETAAREVEDGDREVLSLDPPEQDSAAAAAGDLLVALARAHSSPVFARAIDAYRKRGSAAAAAEFTVTRAPRRTFKALVDLVARRFGRVFLIYDDFSTWSVVPDDVRQGFAATLAELRVAMGRRGTVVFLAAADEVPEIEDQLRTGDAVLWRFPNLEKLFSAPDAYDREVVSQWFEAATLEDARVRIGAGHPTLLAIEDAAQGSLSRFMVMAGAAVDDAASRGAADLDAVSLAAGLAADPAIGG